VRFFSTVVYAFRRWPKRRYAAHTCNVEKRGTVGQATDTHPHTEYVTFIVFPLHQWSHEPGWILRCTHIACLILHAPCITQNIKFIRQALHAPKCSHSLLHVSALRECRNMPQTIRELSGKHPAILNTSRTGRVALMQLGSQSEETLLRTREKSLYRGASQSAVRRR
jgi:hypothetical protein